MAPFLKPLIIVLALVAAVVAACSVTYAAVRPDPDAYLAALRAECAVRQQRHTIDRLIGERDELKQKVRALTKSRNAWRHSRKEQHKLYMKTLRKLHNLQHRLGGSVYPGRAYYGHNRGAAVVALARQFVGKTWYVWGGCSHAGTDCSGLVMHVYAEVGIHLAHGATYQQKASRWIPLSQLRPGDLVFYGGSGYSHHVAIYIGGGHIIEAAHSGTLVRYSHVGNAWCGGTFFH